MNKLKYLRLPLSRIGEGHISAEFQAAVRDKSTKMTVNSVKRLYGVSLVSSWDAEIYYRFIAAFLKSSFPYQPGFKQVVRQLSRS